MAFYKKNKNTDYFINLKNINLKFNQVDALKNINISIKGSETLAIVGEHGAGKTSICNIISGIAKPTSGKIYIRNHSYDALTIPRARSFGIEMVTQQNPLFTKFTIADNIFNIKSKRPLPFFHNRKKIITQAEEILDYYGFNLDPGEMLSNLKLSDRVLIDIIKHIAAKPKLLILDEAIQKISSINLNKLVPIINDLKKSGCAVVIVTHRIDDIYNFADKVSILKNGEILITDSIKNIDKINLIRLAYTQIANSDDFSNINKEFYQFLKYNEAILRKLPVNLIVVDKDTRIKILNENVKNFFDVHRTPLFNQFLETLFTEKNQRVLDLIYDGMKDQHPKTFYNVSIVKGDSVLITNIKVHPVFDETFLIGHTIIIEDITEQEKLREQVMLSEKLASVGLLSAGVAHEINNPLEIISNYTQFLKYEADKPETIKILNNILEEITSISQIVGNLITFSDTTKAHIEDVDINETIASIIELIGHNANYKNIEIVFKQETARLDLKINKTELKQVILNLLKNSFEAMPEGGQLFIQTSLLQKNSHAEVEILFQDSGHGIDDIHIHDIFLPFYSTKSGETYNLGLGLSVSYGIIKKYSGQIEAYNNPEGGCSFKITLPKS